MIYTPDELDLLSRETLEAYEDTGNLPEPHGEGEVPDPEMERHCDSCLCPAFAIIKTATRRAWES